MAQTAIYDPGTSEARSSWLVGLTEACNKITGVLDMKVGTFTDAPLPELYISSSDRYRIYQIAAGKKLWLSSPKPIVKKNGVEISESADGFTIDYLGGSIAFESNKRLTASDTITVSASYVIDQSNTIDEILADIDDLTAGVKRYKGTYATIDDLRNAAPTGSNGEFAVIISEKTFYFWDSATHDWEPIQAVINPQGSTEDSDWFYYGGRNTWQDLRARVLSTVLTGLGTSTAAKIEATDTVLQAFGKIQAQLNDGVLDIKGEGAPTNQTAGKVGQNYIDTTTGKKYHITAINVASGAQQYVWKEYANTDAIPTLDSTPTSGSANGVTSGGVASAMAQNKAETENTYLPKANPVATGSFSLGRKASTTVGSNSTAMGSNVEASNLASHAEGQGTTASGSASHAEGQGTTASGSASHAEGQGTTASGINSHAEGYQTKASNDFSHAEGYQTEASGDYSHAEGYQTEASGDYSHAEGYQTEASGDYSHAEGLSTTASGIASHAEGQDTVASSASQHAQGKYNVEDSGDNYAHIVGNGTANNQRSNAHTLDWEGNAWFAGDVYIGSTGGTNKDGGSVKLVKASDTIDIAHGGTNATTAINAVKNLIAGLSVGTPGSSDYIAFANASNAGKTTISALITAVAAAMTGFAKVETGQYAGTQSASSGWCSVHSASLTNISEPKFAVCYGKSTTSNLVTLGFTFCDESNNNLVGFKVGGSGDSSTDTDSATTSAVSLFGDAKNSVYYYVVIG